MSEGSGVQYCLRMRKRSRGHHGDADRNPIVQWERGGESGGALDLCSVPLREMRAHERIALAARGVGHGQGAHGAQTVGGALPE